MSLHNLIKKDTHTVNETSVPQLQRYIQKLANADQIFMAYCALFDEQNSLLTSMNNEAKTRRSTKSVVLGKGKGKVMSYEDIEDIEEAPAKHAEKDAIKGKGKRGRKRKGTVQDAEEPEPELPCCNNNRVQLLERKQKQIANVALSEYRESGRDGTINGWDGIMGDLNQS